MSQKTRINQQIRVDKVRLISDDGSQVGIIDTSEALQRAKDAGLDLVEVSPNAKPPVCKIVDWGKYNYRKTKEQQKNRKNQRNSEVKQIRFGLKIGEHDLDVKLRKVNDFLKSGHKVKLSVFFRGREMAHKELGEVLLEKAINKLDTEVNVDQKPAMQGRYMTMVIRSK
ncbi:TPA: translation initiation factor IF-3 [Candidatus Saccharibacteria bacterium]|nr:translation initiation factor IF-3 [Candidatus Saccharibacteria bacterium]HIO87685.1 translation initiation factor IF-3 [Candidatus Saccharibacteria bacterium]